MKWLDLAVYLALRAANDQQSNNHLDAWIALVGVVLSAAAALGGVIYVQHATKALKDNENKRANEAVEAGAYGRARESYEAAISRYEKEVARLGGEVDSCRIAANEAQAQATHAEFRAEAAEKRVDRAERRITQLEEYVREHELPVPPYR